MLVKCQDQEPHISQDVFIAEGTKVIGDVHIGEKSSIWFNVVIRGDVAPIRIGSETNIQDNTVIHGTWKKAAVRVGNGVTIGHSAILHGCTIEDQCLIGMGSIVMDGAHISQNSIVGAGSLVTEGSQFPPGMLILGRPAKALRPLTPDELAFLPKSASNYITYTSWY
jgi:carbonic anhydrase/acetyltransferase-like protein (isoleucine patch superfamily)